jgi:hypothetical protein
MVDQEAPATKARPAEEALHTMVGVADIVLNRVESTARQMRAVLAGVRRSDLADLIREGHDDLKARGRLALGRHSSESHLEVLARRAAAGRRSAGHV